MQRYRIVPLAERNVEEGALHIPLSVCHCGCCGIYVNPCCEVDVLRILGFILVIIGACARGVIVLVSWIIPASSIEHGWWVVTVYSVCAALLISAGISYDDGPWFMRRDGWYGLIWWASKMWQGLILTYLFNTWTFEVGDRTHVLLLICVWWDFVTIEFLTCSKGPDGPF